MGPVVATLRVFTIHWIPCSGSAGPSVHNQLEPVFTIHRNAHNLTVAAGLVAAIGDVRRFPSPQKLVSYVGLNPRVRQSGLGLAQYGRISKHGRAHVITAYRETVSLVPAYRWRGIERR